MNSIDLATSQFYSTIDNITTYDGHIAEYLAKKSGLFDLGVKSLEMYLPAVVYQVEGVNGFDIMVPPLSTSEDGRKYCEYHTHDDLFWLAFGIHKGSVEWKGTGYFAKEPDDLWNILLLRYFDQICMTEKHIQDVADMVDCYDIERLFITTPDKFRPTGRVYMREGIFDLRDDLLEQ